MGFSDRDYSRNDLYDDDGYKKRRRVSGSMSITMRLVILNVALWLINGLLFPGSNRLTDDILALHSNDLANPLNWYQLVSYGFAHTPNSIWHLFGNMLILIMFGYGMMLGIGPGGFGLVRGDSVENRLGRTEYLVFYLLTILIGGIVFAVTNPDGIAFGASGGAVGVVILFALMFPNKTLLLYGILPVPMWALGAFIVFMDAQGASGVREGGIAYSVHLAGAAFALIYYFGLYNRGYRLTRGFETWITEWQIGKPKNTNKPKFKIYTEESTKSDSTKSPPKSLEEIEFDKRLDDILKRYGQVGDAGLTPEEREFLQKASKKYRDRK
ncbi:MAG: rhomboid family intramembrane serine protease [Thermoguttaceae bacterium]